MATFAGLAAGCPATAGCPGAVAIGATAASLKRPLRPCSIMSSLR